MGSGIGTVLSSPIFVVLRSQTVSYDNLHGQWYPDVFFTGHMMSCVHRLDHWDVNNENLHGQWYQDRLQDQDSRP